MSAAPQFVRLISNPRERVVARFMSKILMDENGCWLWTAAKDKDGYGSFQYSGRDGSDISRKERAPRVSMMLFSDIDISGVIVCHKCDNPACVNPEHLFVGDAKSNVDDRVHKGRSAKGDSHGRKTNPDAFERGADKRRKKYLFNGKVTTLREIADKTGIDFKILRSRVGRGWPVERAASEPVHNRGQSSLTGVSVVIMRGVRQ